MNISLNDWIKYRDVLSKLSQKAADEYRDYFFKRSTGLANATRNELIDVAYAIISKYSEGTAELACEMYDAIAKLSNVNVPAAVPAEPATINEVAKAVNGSLKQSPNGNLVEGVIQRLVKQAGADTTLQNALRDKAQFAWIPSGDTCAFCITLASRGWQYMSKNALKNGHAEHIHAHCDCQYAVRFDNKTNVAGYDPDKYKEMYNSYDGTPQEKINAMRRDFYAKSTKRLSKNITLDDVIKSNNGNIIEKEIIDRIGSSLLKHNALRKFDNVSVQDLGNNILFNTNYKQNGNWYDTELQINSNFFGGISLEEAEELILNAPNTVCDSIDDAIAHEIIHAEMASRYQASIINNLDSEPGKKGISTTAEKDLLETLSEIGVLKKQGKYGNVKEDSKELFEKYLGDYKW